MKNIDYNKPKISWVTGKPLDNTKVIAEEWLLKPQFTPVQLPSVSGYSNFDFKDNNRSVIVIGTKLQIYNKFCEMLRDYGWQQQDSWSIDLKPSYRMHYKNNNKQPLIINLI